MHLLTTLLPLSGLTTAINIPFSPFTRSKCNAGNPGAVYTCSGPNFSGNCNYRMPNDACFKLTEAPKSIGPDMGGYCVIFDDSECNGNIIQWGGPTVSNHMNCPGVVYPQNGLDKAGSMRCHVGA